MDSHSDMPAPDEQRVTYVYDAHDRLIIPVDWGHCFETTTYTYSVERRIRPFTFEHDKQKRLFILTWPDGKTEHFRDNPARQLMVEPDPETGEMRPVIKNGEPAYLYTCREERELA
jgi:hypothetical protein